MTEPVSNPYLFCFVFAGDALVIGGDHDIYCAFMGGAGLSHSEMQFPTIAGRRLATKTLRVPTQGLR